MQDMWETDLADRELVNFKRRSAKNSEYTEAIQGSIYKLLGWGGDVKDFRNCVASLAPSN